MTMIMTDEMIMIDDDYRNCDYHHGSASSAVKSSFSSFARHHTSSSSSATTHGNLRRSTERNTLRPVIISFSFKETRKNIINYQKIMKNWPKSCTRSHPPSFSFTSLLPTQCFRSRLKYKNNTMVYEDSFKTGRQRSDHAFQSEICCSV